MRNRAQLNMFDQKGISSRFNVDCLGYYKFVPAPSNRIEDTCYKCALWSDRFGMTPWCERAHCRSHERVDHQDGYFVALNIEALASKSSLKNSPGSAGATVPNFGRCDKCYFGSAGSWCRFLKKPVLPNSNECEGNWQDINSVER